YSQAQELKKGPIDQRLRFVVFAGEVKGPKTALAELEGLRDREQGMTIEQRQLLDVLTRLYEDEQRQALHLPSIRDDERDLLREELDWAGDLALHPAGGPDGEGRAALLAQATITFAVLILVVVVGLMLGLAGLAVLVVLAALAIHGRVHSGLAEPSDTGSLYA